MVCRLGKSSESYAQLGRNLLVLDCNATTFILSGAWEMRLDHTCEDWVACESGVRWRGKFNTIHRHEINNGSLELYIPHGRGA